MANDKAMIRNSTAEFLIFVHGAKEDGVEVRYQDGTIWLTQKIMAELFDVNVRTVNEHLQNIFSGGELEENSVIRYYRITAHDGKNYTVKHYNLDAIISVCIDSLIKKIKQSIGLLKEYRSALITAAVTGKIDVREESQMKNNPKVKK